MPKTVGVAVSNATFHFDKLYTYAVMPAQQDAVRRKALVQLVLGEGVAVLVDGLAAHGCVGVVEGVAVLFGDLIEDADRLLDDLRAGAVAPDDSNVLFHSGSFMQNSPSRFSRQTSRRGA